MKINVNRTSYVDGHVGVFEIDDDATPEQIAEAVQDFAFKNDTSGLCHQCSDALGELNNTSYIAEDDSGEIVYQDSYQSELLEWRSEVLAALGLPSSAVGEVPAILRAIRVTEIRSPAHWHPKTGNLYVGAYRRKSWKNFKAGDRFQKNASSLRGPLVTDPIKRDEEVVIYQDADTLEEYVRPAAMFDDGRFIRIGGES